jgi:hypothetical protein
MVGLGWQNVRRKTKKASGEAGLRIGGTGEFSATRGVLEADSTRLEGPGTTHTSQHGGG